MAGKKIIILVAPTGNQKDVPGSHVPVTPDEIAEESFRCYKAGAAVVHIHARDPKTRLASGDMKIFGESIRKIKEKSDILVQTTTSLGLKQDPATGKWVWHSSEERMGLLTIDPPQDLLSCAMGSWEFIHPEGGQGNPSTQINGYDFMKTNISNMVKKNIPWEMEIADTGFLQNAKKLADDGAFDGKANNFWLDYVMGFGGMPATPRQLIHMVEEGQRLFPQAPWETNATGRDQFRMNILGAAMGCDIVRVGFEDSVWLPDGKQAKNNYEQVAAMTDLALKLGREIATPAEAWEMLGGSQRARAA